jgi:serine/threonine protein phosphatase PrpC
MMMLKSTAATHKGRRSNNEDAYMLQPELGLFVVADGMGGYDGGEVASRLAVEIIEAFFLLNARDSDTTWPHALKAGLSFTENMVEVAVKLAHEGICARKRVQHPHMGTTVAALVLGDGQATIAHVGDSRVYLLRQDELQRLTRDHSLYEELLRSGTRELPDRAACGFGNVITRALGMDAAHPDLSTVAVRVNDRFLLCTDGLLEGLSDALIAELVRGAAPEKSCPALVEGAYHAGGRDNITAVVVEVLAV